MRTCDDFAPKLLVRDVYACDIAEWETKDKATFTFGETLNFTRVWIQASAHHAITIKAEKDPASMPAAEAQNNVMCSCCIPRQPHSWDDREGQRHRHRTPPMRPACACRGT